MTSTQKWVIAYMVMILVLLITLGAVYQRVQAQPAWDGTWDCRPGETYTVKECP